MKERRVAMLCGSRRRLKQSRAIDQADENRMKQGSAPQATLVGTSKNMMLADSLRRRKTRNSADSDDRHLHLHRAKNSVLGSDWQPQVLPCMRSVQCSTESDERCRFSVAPAEQGQLAHSLHSVQIVVRQAGQRFTVSIRFNNRHESRSYCSSIFQALACSLCR